MLDKKKNILYKIHFILASMCAMCGETLWVDGLYAVAVRPGFSLSGPVFNLSAPTFTQRTLSSRFEYCSRIEFITRASILLYQLLRSFDGKIHATILCVCARRFTAYRFNSSTGLLYYYSKIRMWTILYYYRHYREKDVRVSMFYDVYYVLYASLL